MAQWIAAYDEGFKAATSDPKRRGVQSYAGKAFGGGVMGSATFYGVWAAHVLTQTEPPSPSASASAKKKNNKASKEEEEEEEEAEAGDE